MTYQLPAGLLGAVNSTVDEVRITRLAESTFYTVVAVDTPGGLAEVDARPSDALNWRSSPAHRSGSTPPCSTIPTRLGAPHGSCTRPAPARARLRSPPPSRSQAPARRAHRDERAPPPTRNRRRRASLTVRQVAASAQSQRALCQCQARDLRTFSEDRLFPLWRLPPTRECAALSYSVFVGRTATFVLQPLRGFTLAVYQHVMRR